MGSNCRCLLSENMGSGQFDGILGKGDTSNANDATAHDTHPHDFYATAIMALVTVIAAIIGLSSGYALIEPQILVYLTIGMMSMYGIQCLFAPQMFCELHFNMQMDAWHAFFLRIFTVIMMSYLAALYLMEPLVAVRLNTASFATMIFMGPYYVQAFRNTKTLHWSALFTMGTLLILHAFSFAGNPSVHTSGIQTYSQGYLLFSFIAVMGYCIQIFFFPSLFWWNMGLEGKTVDPWTQWLIGVLFAAWGAGKL